MLMLVIVIENLTRAMRSSTISRNDRVWETTSSLLFKGMFTVSNAFAMETSPLPV